MENFGSEFISRFMFKVVRIVLIGDVISYSLDITKVIFNLEAEKSLITLEVVESRCLYSIELRIVHNKV